MVRRQRGEECERGVRGSVGVMIMRVAYVALEVISEAGFALVLWIRVEGDATKQGSRPG